MKGKNFLIFAIIFSIYFSSILISINSLPSIHSNNNLSKNISLKMGKTAWQCTSIEVVSTESINPSSTPEMALDDNGNIHVVWYDSNFSGFEYDVFYKYWNASMNIWTPTEMVSMNFTNYSQSSTIAVDHLGNVHIAWWEGLSYMGNDEDIYYRCWNHTSGSWLSPILVSAGCLADSRTPDMVVDEQGNAHIVWFDYSNYSASGNDTDVLYRCWNSTTSAWNPIEVISTESSSNSWNPTIAVDKDRNLHVVWSDISNYSVAEYGHADIFYKRWNATLATWTLTEVVSTESNDSNRLPSIAADRNGNVHIAWDLTNGTIGDRDIVYKCWNSTTQNWTISEIISIDDPLNSAKPAVAVDSCLNVHVIWSDVTDFDIHYSRRDYHTTHWTAPSIISTPSIYGKIGGAIAVDDYDDLHVVWADKTDFDGEDDYDIFYRKIIRVPDAPLLNPISPNPNEDGRIELNWSDVIGATQYYVFRSDLNITSVDSLIPISTIFNNNSYTDILTENGLYFYVIVAENSSRNSTISNCESVEVKISSPIPSFSYLMVFEFIYLLIFIRLALKMPKSRIRISSLNSE